MRSFAVVPACGQSTRMGEPKLLMPWRGQTVIEAVLDAWAQSRVTELIVVARKSDARLRNLCSNKNCQVVLPPSDPEDMRESIEHALRFIANSLGPEDSDAWLLAPADMPALRPATVDRLLDNYTGQMLVPMHKGRKGHPVVLPWSSAQAVFALPQNVGVNQLIQAATQFVETPEIGGFADIDTPADYRRLHERGDL